MSTSYQFGNFRGSYDVSYQFITSQIVVSSGG